ncbi:MULTISPECIES: VanZ family protein [unclassified Microbacterium]|uniref:VanZ family protein n=1 Tax=unclassified Microbacterium TaxID=2609290 RepID=UPI0025D4F5D1|nr:VanZ family protein [Microbacterium sp.]
MRSGSCCSRCCRLKRPVGSPGSSPSSHEWRRHGEPPFDAVYAVLEFSANIVLFAPLGVLLALAWPRASAGALIAVGGASSVAIELAQLAIPGRFSTLSDVIANTLGTAIGVLVIRTLGRRRRRAGDGGHR